MTATPNHALHANGSGCHAGCSAVAELGVVRRGCAHPSIYFRPMKTIRFIGALFAFAMSAAAFAADPAGTWKWSTSSPDGDIPTTLRLESKNGQLAGAYSNRHGKTAISNASLQGDVIRFDVVRDLGGQKYVVKYHGKIEGDTIRGTIAAPGHDGGPAVKLDWNAKRTTKEEADAAKPKG